MPYLNIKKNPEKILDIIVPVYDGLVETQNCLKSVLCSKSSNNEKFNLTIINDSSPNLELTEWLREFVAAGDATLIENKENQGFVKTVNLGMRLHEERDVILLNSDTIVAGDWVDRIIKCSQVNKQAATVTPFSNNATICSFPDFCKENLMLPYADVTSCHSAMRSNNGYVEIPTAVGFCMWINRGYINKVGYFDCNTFGKGYGEENDFCMRCARIGGKHLLCVDVFVAHVGGISFLSEKNDRVDRAQVLLDELYPNYHNLVSAHVKLDPAERYRIRGIAELIRKSKCKKILLISHNMGGGVEAHLRELESQLSSESIFLCLRPSDIGYRLSFGVDVELSLDFVVPDDYSDLLQLLSYICVERVHIHHTMGVDPIIQSISVDLGVELDFTLHDYYLINANPTLTNDKGVFAEDEHDRDSLCEKRYELPHNISADEWRNGQKSLLDRCDRIISPSKYAAELFHTYYPEYQVIVAPHLDSEQDEMKLDPRNKRIGDDGVFRILVLGALSPEKGASLLEEVAVKTRKSNIPIEFHLLGYAYRGLDPSVHVHGAYNEYDLDQKISEINPHVVWFPALWPETYSYTLSASIRNRLPVVVPNIGAFAERVAGRMFSMVVPWNWTSQKFFDLFCEIRNNGWNEGVSPKEPDAKSFFYKDMYLAWGNALIKENNVQFPDDFINNALQRKNYEGASLLFREKILRVIIKNRERAVFCWLAKIVPFAMQRKIKRLLSKRPVYEFM